MAVQRTQGVEHAAEEGALLRLFVDGGLGLLLIAHGCELFLVRAGVLGGIRALTTSFLSLEGSSSRAIDIRVPSAGLARARGRARLDERICGGSHEAEGLERVVGTQTITADAGSIEAHASKGLWNRLTMSIVWHTREPLRELVVKHCLVELGL